MNMTEAMEEDVEEFGDWIYDFYGRKRFARDMAKSREEGILKGREEGILKGREEGILKGREEGILKGREEGILKGREEERQKNILNMLKMKYPLASIATILQLSEDEILKIAKDNNIDIPSSLFTVDSKSQGARQ